MQKLATLAIFLVVAITLSVLFSTWRGREFYVDTFQSVLDTYLRTRDAYYGKPSSQRTSADQRILNRLLEAVNSRPENCQIAKSKYLKANPDVSSQNLDPWVHFREYGYRERRAWPTCVPDVAAPTPVAAPVAPATVATPTPVAAPVAPARVATPTPVAAPVAPARVATPTPVAAPVAPAALPGVKEGDTVIVSSCPAKLYTYSRGMYR
jgi:hypothetical protein